MGIGAWILLGLVAGALAKLIMPGKDPGGCIVTTILGVVGAVLGGYLASYFLGWGTIEEFDFRSVAVATVGAILLLLIYRLIKGSPKDT